MSKGYKLEVGDRAYDKKKWTLITIEEQYKICRICQTPLEEGYFCRDKKTIFCKKCEMAMPLCPFLTVQESLKSEMHGHFYVVVVEE